MATPALITRTIGAPILQVAIPSSANYQQTSGSNAAQTLTLTAIAGHPTILKQVAWSYSAAPTGGQITVKDGASNTLFDHYITAGGFDGWTFDPPISLTAGNDLTVLIAAGGTGIFSKVTVNLWAEN